jgi:hypothetical protein
MRGVPSRRSLVAAVLGSMAASVAGLAVSTAGTPAARAGTASHLETVVPPPAHLSAPVRAAALTPDSGGYWLVGADGGVLTGGDAGFFGSAGNMRLSAPIVGMAATPDGRGYWLVGSDGGIMTYGDAPFLGSAGNLRLSAPIVAMAATPDGRGYWLVGSDGGIMTYGDAGFFGSAGTIRLGAPIVAMAPTPDGAGYWLVGSDGGVMTYGDAPFLGSAGNLHLGAPVGAMAATSDGKGYWLVGWDGGVMTYGDAPFLGTGQGHGPITAVTTSPAIQGYVLAAANGTVISLGPPAAAAQSVPAPSEPPAAPTTTIPDPTTTTVPGSTSSGAQGISTPQTPSVPIGSAPSVPGSSSSSTGGGSTSAGSDTSYTFMYPNGSNGSSARWNPCAPIRWAVNLSDAPSTALADAQQAVAAVSAATGISFSYVGTTSAIPSPTGAAGQLPSGVDAVIAWLTPSQFGATGGEAGYGGNWWISSGGPERIFQGYAIINGDLAKSLLKPGFGQGYSEGHLLLHELGHMMGLGHTQDESQVMYPQQGPLSPGTYGAGDLAGLRTLGTGGCLS